MKNIIIIVLIIIVGVLSAMLFNKNTGIGLSTNNLGQEIESLRKDLDFYKYFGAYKSLLGEEDFDYMNRQIEKFEDDESLGDLAVLIYANELIKRDPKNKEIMETLRDEVKEKISENNSKTSKDDLFQKNTSCASLTQGIKSGLESKDSTYSSEKLEFIFYSPSLNTCIYSTEYIFSSRSGDYSSQTSKKVYNANSQSLIGSYVVYTSEDYEDSSKAEQSERARKNYTKYILENSNYNVELLKDVSYIYF